jgi:membrane protein
MNKARYSIYDKIISIVGSVYSEEDPGIDKDDAIWHPVVHPVTQVGLVFTFTVVTSTLYVFFLYVTRERNRIPSEWQFYVLVVTYLLTWASFRLERLPQLAGSKFSVVTGNGTESNASQWPPPTVELHSQYHKVKIGVAVRVFAMVVASIAISCWFAIYSGGPFQSAYSQIIVAYPLFATNIARNKYSLIAVYALTFSLMLVYEEIKWWHYSLYETQSTSWYIGIMIFLLIGSAAVAANSRGIARNVDKISKINQK